MNCELIWNLWLSEKFAVFSVSNEKKFEPKIPKTRNKIEVSVSSKNFGENRNFLFTFIFMLKFINFHLLSHSNQTVMTPKSLIFA
jgi:hypothetical protein